MSLAYGSFDELNHQLRFLLFEAGIGLSQKAVEYYLTRAHRHCLERLRKAAVTEQLINAPLASHHVTDFLDILQHRLKQIHPASLFYQWQTVREELDQSIANDALAQAYRQHWHRELLGVTAGSPSLWHWLNLTCSDHEMLEFLEQWGCIGHPYHPNFRSKAGFSRREVMQYSPEFNAQVSLHWAAICRDYAHTTSHALPYHQLIAQQFPKDYQRWCDNLHFKQINSEQFYPLPIHPWQWRNQIVNLFADLIDNKDLLLIPHHQSTRPSMSFRTMMTGGSRCHLKLAAAVHTTSALRTVSPASVNNGPVLSAWLCALLAKQEHYQQTLFLASDLAGINCSHPAIPAHQKNQLALLVRENPLSQTSSNQRLVPLAALFALSPITQKPLLIEIIEASGMSALNYFQHYCQLILTSQFQLMLHYGVALECHQQNTLIAFNTHQPSALVVRDLGGIKISTHSLYDVIAKPTFHPDSTITAASLDEVGNKFIHGNLQSNLACWIQHLHCHYQLMPLELWQIVYTVIRQLFKTISPSLNPILVNHYQQQLLNRPWQHKSLLSMRLNQGQQQDLFVPISNPLSHFHD